MTVSRIKEKSKLLGLRSYLSKGSFGVSFNNINYDMNYDEVIMINPKIHKEKQIGMITIDVDRNSEVDVDFVISVVQKYRKIYFIDHGTQHKFIDWIIEMCGPIDFEIIEYVMPNINDNTECLFIFETKHLELDLVDFYDTDSNNEMVLESLRVSYNDFIYNTYMMYHAYICKHPEVDVIRLII